ncbi:MAG TPA: 4Fe-4S dicluster domain-containing protein [Chloroflexota bacterium]
MRNFPILSDLVVDVSGVYRRMSAAELHPTRKAEPVLPCRGDFPDPAFAPGSVNWPDSLAAPGRFETCIECGLCMSACPTMAADGSFLGPLGLAALYRARQETDDPKEKARLLALADGEQGAWRCHSAFECGEACPQGVDLPGMIMSLRRDLTRQRVKKLFRSQP